MGRPPSGAPRRNLVAFRLTDAEAATLDAERGAMPRSMYARRKVLSSPLPAYLPDRAGEVRAVHDTPLPEPGQTGRHTHRATGDPVRSWYEKGVLMRVYQCSCGVEMSPR